MTFNRGSTFLFSILAFGLLFGFMPDAMAGCRINYAIQNNSNKALKIYSLSVKSRGGTWRPVLSNYGMGGGTKHQDIYRAAFSCKAKRRYRFEISNALNFRGYGTCKSFYYPSATGWTKSTDINFGDISRYCR